MTQSSCLENIRTTVFATRPARAIAIYSNLEALLGDHVLDSIGSQDLYQFLILLTEGRAKSIARLRYTQLKAFFAF
jgi:hypothetical protein